MDLLAANNGCTLFHGFSVLAHFTWIAHQNIFLFIADILFLGNGNALSVSPACRKLPSIFLPFQENMGQYDLTV